MSGTEASMYVYLDGRIVPKEQATVSVYDHGFLYGDGLFVAAVARHSEAARATGCQPASFAGRSWMEDD